MPAGTAAAAAGPASGVATAAAVAMCTRNLRLARTARRALGVTTVPELPRRAR